MKPEKTNTKNIEWIMNQGFIDTGVRQGDRIEVWERGEERIVYDRRYDRIADRYKVREINPGVLEDINGMVSYDDICGDI